MMSVGRTIAENVGTASRSQLAEPIRLLVERVQGSGRTVDPMSIEWTPPARPFFEEVARVLAPPDGPEHTRPTFRIAGLDELVARLIAA